ncbi:tetratricopeptide repeat protein [Halothermothrix orenii]|uniref:Tetratricopeptide TPR_2 repeat protein n=1 Tax=Halothermothrix orenii (strain H 168 / OCM 544 / DSM 9562) TaxID=373903 RepID=B8CX88_HALOH|nr:tetratricopeptide repeat protein [Halothermothrix orenii]ACL69907.1 Tetratricopeptide TPR_2 repeat protein [Halothermothrix orenii H 168]
MTTGFNIVTANTSSKIDWNSVKNQANLILKQDPDNILYSFRLAIAMANLGEIEKSYNYIQGISNRISTQQFNKEIKPYLERLGHKENRNNLMLLNYAAFSASINNNHKKAKTYFERIVKLDPDNVWMKNYLAATLLELDFYDQAEDILKKAIKMKSNKYSHLLLGLTYYEQGKYFKALYEFTKSGDLVNRFVFK